MKRNEILTYAFVVDGKTEMWYLQMLKRNERGVNIAVKPELTQKKSLEAQFQQVCELSQAFHSVFWIVDIDVVVKEKRDGHKLKIEQLAKFLNDLPNNAFFIPNMPCLEYWFLLHIRRTSRLYLDGKSIENELNRSEKLKGYEKTEKFFVQANDIYKKLKPYLQDAIGNAKQLPDFDITNLEQGLCRMHEIFERLAIE